MISLPTDIIKYIIDRSSGSSKVLIRHVCRSLHDRIDPSPYFNRYLCETAACEGYLNLVIWAKNKGYTWNKNNVCIVACLHGHTDVIDFAISENATIEKSWIDSAILAGHRNMIGYSRTRSIIPSVDVAYEMASKGDLDTLKMLDERVHYTSKVYSSLAMLAAERKHQHILLWLKKEKNVLVDMI